MFMTVGLIVLAAFPLPAVAAGNIDIKTGFIRATAHAGDRLDP